MSAQRSDNHDGNIEKFLQQIRERYDFQCKSANLLCYSCSGNGAVPMCFLHNRYPKWCISLACSEHQCGRKWHACYKCNNSVKMYRLCELEKHEAENHVHSQPILTDVLFSVHGDNDIVTELQGYFSDHEGWANFFLHHRGGNALRYLVANQFLDAAEPSCISTSDAELHVLIASLCYILTKGQKAQFAKILRRIVEKTNSDSVGDDYTGFHCQIPQSRLELTRYVEGTKAIMTNVPVPRIYSASNGDAYVRLPDVLKLYLSFGLRPSTVRLVN